MSDDSCKENDEHYFGKRPLTTVINTTYGERHDTTGNYNIKQVINFN